MSRNLAHANLYVLFFLPRRLMIGVNASRKSPSDQSPKPNRVRLPPPSARTPPCAAARALQNNSCGPRGGGAGAARTRRGDRLRAAGAAARVHAPAPPASAWRPGVAGHAIGMRVQAQAASVAIDLDGLHAVHAIGMRVQAQAAHVDPRRLFIPPDAGVGKGALPNMYKPDSLTHTPEQVIAAWPAAYPPDYTHPRCREAVSRIAERGHRIVHMYPLGAPRIYSQKELWAIASKCSVRYRGYPHPCMKDGVYGATYNMNRCIGASHTALGDAWWFWDDGQLVDARALFWDGGLTRVARPRHLEPIEALYDMNEVLAFAANLATLTGMEYFVRISFGNMRSTTLNIHTQNWGSLYKTYRSRGDSIVLPPAVVEPHAARELYAPIALERTLDLLAHYGMDREAPRYKLAREQGWFYGRHLRATRCRWRGGLCSDDYP